MTLRLTARPAGAVALLALGGLLAACSSSSPAPAPTPPRTSAPPAALPTPAASAPALVAAPGPPTRAQYATAAGGVPLPDRAVTPGAVDPAATRAVVCGADHRQAVPPPSYQDKQTVYATYGVTDRASVRIDHLVPVSLGGTSAVTNLWPQPVAGGHGEQKDQLELRLHDLVCRGGLSLAAAQGAVMTDWVAAARTYLPKPGA